VTVLVELLARLRSTAPGVDIATHRSYYQYEFHYSVLAGDHWQRAIVKFCLNDPEDIGKYFGERKRVLAWFAERFGAAAPSSGVELRLPLWTAPVNWFSQWSRSLRAQSPE
jgi:hypothetical protein